jgi:hypothetical protein
MPGGCRHNASAPNGGWNYGAGKEAALTAHSEVFKGSNCRKVCLEAQLNAYYGDDDSRPLSRPSTQALGSRREDMAKKFPRPAGFSYSS